MNTFEFVILAGARARQLQAGCTPKVAGGTARIARVAMQEIREGKVERVETDGENGEIDRKARDHEHVTDGPPERLDSRTPARSFTG